MSFLKQIVLKKLFDAVGNKEISVYDLEDGIQEKSEKFSEDLEILDDNQLNGRTLVETETIREILAECGRLREDSRLFIEILKEKDQDLEKFRRIINDQNQDLGEAKLIICDQNIWINSVAEKYLKPYMKTISNRERSKSI